MERMHPKAARTVPRVSVPRYPKSSYGTLCTSASWQPFPQQRPQDQQRDLVFQQHQVVNHVVREEIRPSGAEHRVIVCVACCVAIFLGAVEFKQEAAVEQHHVKELGVLHSGKLIRPLMAGPELLLYGLERLQVDVGRVLRAIKEVEERMMLVALHVGGEGGRGGAGPAKQARE
ncbi:hypothetical protein AMTRI_Chr08g165720 [Amborella trichopoda]